MFFLNGSALVFASLGLWIVCFFLCAGQSALISLPDSMVKERADEPGVFGRIAALLDKPSRFDDAMRFWRRTLILLLQMLLWNSVVFPVILPLFGKLHPILYGLTAILLFLILLCVVTALCQTVPRSIGNRYHLPLASAFCSFCTVMTYAATPFVWIVNGIASLVTMFLGKAPQQDDGVTEEEIRLMVDMGNEKGAIEKSEKDMINNVFAFDDRTVNQVMTHRTDVTALPEDASLSYVMQVVTDSWYSRIPVYRESVDNIIGVLYVKDLLELVGKTDASFSLDRYMREIIFVPENMRCRDLFVQFQEKKVQIAVVVDEYGGTFGIVSMEDLLESIVGNIQDEYDNEDEDIFRLANNSFLLKGSVPVADVEQFFDITIKEDPEDEYDTFGGLLVHLLGGLPPSGTHPSIALSGIQFTVAVIEERRIAYIRAKKAEDSIVEGLKHD